ncbi:hypothetical protein [Lignipirellula cremea]|uniref:Uncharacterized protein n=1 Tax=Lignipirellula cremea TaxID=2528010 RepID=A0A518DPF7_9BACT|nr:hypothetical protein [Lignipirellula cremea]QDU93714.1 hypothetical protein Pla8534_14950 [Lignipirellula cremea]
MNDYSRSQLVSLGKAQIDGMFARQDDYPVDDSEFLPLVEIVLTAFEAIDRAVAAELWDYAYAVYDRVCKEVEPESTTDENRQLMQSYLLGERRLK